MIKKVGVVMAYKKGHTNYGTSLQGYALLRVLKQLGYNVEVINYVKQLTIKQKLDFCINMVRASGLLNFISLFLKRKNHNNDYLQNIKERTKAVEKFKEKKIVPLIRSYVGFESLRKGSKNYDAIIVGSDQVWRPESLSTKFFNLLFVDDEVRKISYASSFGVSSIPKFQRKRTGEYLDRFYRIGVREIRGKEIVDSLSHKTATIVADPTILLSVNEWDEEIKDSIYDEEEPYIFCYFLGDNPHAREAVNYLKEKTGLRIITIRHMDEYIKDDDLFGDEAPYNVGPDDFVKLISKAQYVCTDSFHCTVFSCLYHRQFMTFYRFAIGSKTGRNSRIDSLFDVLMIGKNHIYNNNIMNIEEPIDWDIVDSRRQKLKEESIIFLKEALL